MGPVGNNGRKLSACHLCRVMVASTAEHEGSARHQAARELAAAALGRLRAQLAPRTTLRDDDIGDKPASPDATDSDTDIDQVFCGACATIVPVMERNHSRCKAHLMAALDEQLLDELVREYVEEEDLTLMEAPSKDPSDVEPGDAAENSEVAEKYQCYLCDVPIPRVFRAEHELGVRHRANLACASAAARRISAYLAPTNSTILPLETTTEDKITPLLKLYVKPDTKNEPEILEIDQVKEAEVDVIPEKRLTSKEYFKDVQQHLDDIGEFCALILDDTEYVTVQTGKNTLRVHAADFNGVYNVGGEMKCRMCDHNNFHVSYSTAAQQDKVHVMSLGHIGHVLTPIDNVHGIRKIDNINYFCIICNVLLQSTSDVKSHITTDVQHTALLPEALKRGKDFQETKDDLKIILYGHKLNSNMPKHYSYYSSFGVPDIQQTVKPSNFVTGPKFGVANQTEQKSSLFGQSSSISNNTLGKSNKQNLTFVSGTPPTISQPSQNTFGFTPKSNAQTNTFGSGSQYFPTKQAFGAVQSTGDAPTLLNSFGTAPSFSRNHTQPK